MITPQVGRLTLWCSVQHRLSLKLRSSVKQGFSIMPRIFLGFFSETFGGRKGCFKLFQWVFLALHPVGLNLFDAFRSEAYARTKPDLFPR